MAHEILNNMFVERKSRVPAWHKLGKVIPNDRMTAIDTASEIGWQTVEPRKVPMQYTFADKVYDVPDKFLIVRDDPEGKPVILSDSTGEFTLVGNMELAKMFQPMSLHFPVETAGVLYDGELVFMTFTSQHWAVKVNGKEDELNDFIYVVNSHKPGKSLQVGQGSTRIVCANTLALGLNNAAWKLPLAHTANVGLITTAIGAAFASIGEKNEAYRSKVQALADQRMNLQQAQAVFAAAFPQPKQAQLVTSVEQLQALHSGNQFVVEALQAEALVNAIGLAKYQQDKTQDRIERRRLMAEFAWNEMAEGQGLGENAWVAINAVTEVLQHGADNVRGNVPQDYLFGDRNAAVKRAMKAVYELA